VTILYTVKKQLTGPAFTRLMQAKHTNKYRIAKNTGIAYQTLYNWESGRFRPSDENAELIGKFLGLIPDSDEITRLERQAAEIQATLERLK